MKSRLITITAVAVTLLLGMVATNVNAQLTSTADVDFLIGSGTSTTWRQLTDATTPEDTVGRAFKLRVQWTQPTQTIDVTQYVVTLPVGTAVNETQVNAATKLMYRTSAANPYITDNLTDARIDIEDANPAGDDYDPSAQPVITITAPRNLSATNQYVLEITDGLTYGASTIYTNTEDYDATDERPNIYLGFVNTDTPDSVATDTTAFYVSNDGADGVQYNTAISSLLSGEIVSAADSLIVVDRFGNYVPDFWSDAADSIVIAVTNDKGTLSFDGSTDVPAANRSTHASGAKVVLKSTGVAEYAANTTGATYDAAVGSGAKLFERIDLTGMAYADRAEQRDDKIHVPIWLGQANTTGHSAAFPDRVYLTFTKDTDAAIGDTVNIQVKVYSATSSKLASGTKLGVAADNATTIKRVILEGTADEQISRLVLTMDEIDEDDVTTSNDYFNGLEIGAAGAGRSASVTIYDPFGLAHSGTVGTDTDSILFTFKYYDLTVNDDGEITAKTYNADMTDIVQNGQADIVGSYDRPATTLYIEDVIENNILKGGSLVSGEFAFDGSATAANDAVILGTTTHGYTKALMLVAQAFNNSEARDSVLITLEPSGPVAFDMSQLQAALDDDPVIAQDASIPVELPIIALDTGYNKIMLDLSSTTNDLAALEWDDNDTAPLPTNAIINFLIDGVDVVGNDSITITNSTGLAGKDDDATTAITDKSMIYDFDIDEDTADSSVINLGGTGDDALDMRFGMKGINFRVSVKWDPGDNGAANSYGFSPRTQDLGLFSVDTSAAVDSVSSITEVSPNGSAKDTVNATVDLVLSFVVPSTSTLDQNEQDSIYIEFVLPDGGLPSALTTSDVQVSVDNSTWYNAVNVTDHSTETGMENKLWLQTPIKVDNSSTGGTYKAYVKIKNFVNPTKSDTTYQVKVKTTKSTVISRNRALNVSDGSYSMIKLVPFVGGVLTARSDSTPRYFSEVTQATVEAAAGDSVYMRVLLGDKYGNVIDNGSTDSLTFVVKGPSGTMFDEYLTAQQKFGGAWQARRGAMANDTITVGIDSTYNGTSAEKFVMIDSLVVMPVKADDYYVVVMDSAMATAMDSLMFEVTPTIAAQIDSLDPDSNMAGTRGQNLPMLTATLFDTYGNVLADSMLEFSVVYSEDDEDEFVDSNGVDLEEPTADAIDVSTDASGQATVTLMAGQGDSVAVKVAVAGNSAVTAKYFTASLRYTGTVGTISFASTMNPDSLAPTEVGAADDEDSTMIYANIKDGDLITKAYLNVWTSQVDTTDWTVSDPVMMVADSADIASEDSTQWVAKVAHQGLGTIVEYQVMIIDAVDDTTWSDTMMYVAANKRGKRNLNTTATNVADLLRTVYLVADVATPKAMDYFGLDLDVNMEFDEQDILDVLAIWRGTGTLLASSNQQMATKASVDLAYEAVDKSNAMLTLSLENDGALDVAVFQIKYDPEKFVFGEANATKRLEDITLVTNNDEDEGIFHVIVTNTTGRSLAKGSGALVAINVSATGEKFDGTGDISLIKAGFGNSVNTELSLEALSPKAVLPKAFALSQNYPNPFNPSTTIAYDVPEGKEVQVRLNVYNMRGQLVRTLVNEAKDEGSYQVQWNGMDDHGRRVSSGVYFYRIVAGEFSQTRKMVILK